MQHKLSIKHSTHKHTEKITAGAEVAQSKNNKCGFYNRTQWFIQSSTQLVRMHTKPVVVS